VLKVDVERLDSRVQLAVEQVDVHCLLANIETLLEAASKVLDCEVRCVAWHLRFDIVQQEQCLFHRALYMHVDTMLLHQAHAQCLRNPTIAMQQPLLNHTFCNRAVTQLALFECVLWGCVLRHCRAIRMSWLRLGGAVSVAAAVVIFGIIFVITVVLEPCREHLVSTAAFVLLEYLQQRAAGGGRRWQAVASGGKRWQAEAGGGKRWQAVAGGGRPWQAVTDCGRPWQAVAGGGRWLR
jgi:hypothetical protein